MSKERELLKRVLASSHLVTGLEKEIQQLLAQPEQEPMAWIYYRSYGNALFVECITTDHWEIDDHQQEAGVCSNIRPLYSAPPPKREPFGPEERQRLSRAYSTKAEQVAFEEGIIFAEISFGVNND